MARTCFPFEADYLRTAFHPSLQGSVSDFTDILQIGKCTVYKPAELFSKRNCRKNISQRNYLDIIPETNTISAMNIDNVSDSNTTQADNSVSLNSQDGVNSKTGCMITNVTELPGSREIAQSYTNLNIVCQTQRNYSSDIVPNPKDFSSNKANAHVSSIPSDTTDTLKKSLEHNHKSLRNNSEPKSGILVWISYGDRTNSIRNNGCKDNIVNNNLNNIDECMSNRAPCRIPVMVKIYRSSSGSFALMTPSRAHQGQTQPLYLRLKNSHVTLLGTASSPRAPLGYDPSCFLLTLGDREGKSFKFEASSKTAAEGWVQALSGDTFVASSPAAEKANRPTASTPPSSRRLKTEDDTNICHSTTSECVNLNDNNNNNNNNKKSNENFIKGSRTADPPGVSFLSPKTKKHTINHLRPAQTSQARPYFFESSNHHLSVSAFQRDRQMPTLSESSDENEEDWSEED